MISNITRGKYKYRTKLHLIIQLIMQLYISGFLAVYTGYVVTEREGIYVYIYLCVCVGQFCS